MSLGSFSFIIACAYGEPNEYLVKKKFFVKTKNDSPIPNIKLQLFENNTEIDIQTTDINGFSELKYSSYHKQLEVKITDIDGIENLGNFKDTSFVLDENIDENIDENMVKLSWLKK